MIDDSILTKYRSLWICLALTLTTAAVFYQVYGFEFINYDDNVYVYDNPNIQAGITAKSIKWAFTDGYASNWHPLTWLSHTFDWQLFGSNPAGHHLANLIFHVANTLLLFVILKQMTDAIWPSAFVAALFALHPLHVESVAWVSERKDVLSTFFWMLTIWAYVRFVNRPKISNYLLVVLSFTLGLMSKPMLVTLPFVLLLLDYWPLNRLWPSNSRDPRKGGTKHPRYYLLVEKIPLFVMALASSIATFVVQKRGGAIMSDRYSFLVRIANASISYMQYIIKMVWPVHLTIFYPHAGQNVPVLNAVISTAFLLAVTILVLRYAKKQRYLIMGWFWYIGTLVPVTGIVQAGAQARADRFTYIPMTGLFIIVAWGVLELFKKWRYRKIALTFSSLLVISLMSICTYIQLSYWRDSQTLFQHALDVTKDNFIAHTYMSVSLYEQGRLDEAIGHCTEAIQIKPDSPRAHVRMGYMLRQAGRFNEAAKEYRRCLEIKPDDLTALNGLGITLTRQERLEEAVKYFTEALWINPNFVEAHNNLGFAFMQQGKLNEAATHFTEAARLDPQLATAHFHLGYVLVRRGKIVEAVIQLEEALRLKPKTVQYINDLAWLLATTNVAEARDPDRAILLAEHACELVDYKKPEMLDTLAVAYAAAGDFSKAVETAEKALELCQSPEQVTLKMEIKERLSLYKSGKPYVEGR